MCARVSHLLYDAECSRTATMHDRTTPPTTVKRDEQQLRQLREVGYSSHSVAWYA